MTNEFLFLQFKVNLLWLHDPRVVHFALHFVGTYRQYEGLPDNKLIILKALMSPVAFTGYRLPSMEIKVN